MKNETFTPERIKAEADAFFEWDGEDRSLVTTTSCLLFARHIAGLMQARAAQPAPVVPEGCATCNGHGVIHRQSGQTPETYEEWNEDCPDCAAPAQGQQVECQECERLRGELAAMFIAQADEKTDLRSELSALKAQQVGQGPVGYTTAGMLAIAKELPLTGRIGARCKADERWNVPLYTAPQPAPAQDVAGDRIDSEMKLPCEVRLPGGPSIGKGCKLSTLLLALRNRGDDMPWRQRFGVPAPFDPALINLIAAHDKQSGEVKS